jgi:hypothetical protein
MISKIGADSIADEKFPQKKNPKQEAEGRYGKLHDFNCSGEMRTGVGWSGVEKEGGGGDTGGCEREGGGKEVRSRGQHLQQLSVLGGGQKDQLAGSHRHTDQPDLAHLG